MQTRSMTKKNAIFSMTIRVTPEEESTSETMRPSSKTKSESVITKLKSIVNIMTNNDVSENVRSDEITTHSRPSARDVYTPPPRNMVDASTMPVQETTTTPTIVAKKAFLPRFCVIIARFILFVMQSVPSFLESFAGLYALYQLYRAYYTNENSTAVQDDVYEMFEVLLKKKRKIFMFELRACK